MYRNYRRSSSIQLIDVTEEVKRALRSPVGMAKNEERGVFWNGLSFSRAAVILRRS